ncbi:hypothetical protein [uncultured Duncaniella sp.]|nr:hypothetical protein [uncultured Duncaniella sp.]
MYIKWKKTRSLLQLCGVIMIAAILFSGCNKQCRNTGYYEAEWMLTDSFPLNDSLMTVLKAPESVMCYILKPSDGTDVFIRDSVTSIKLNPGQLTVLQYLLLFDNRNYTCDSIIVQSPNIPAVEFEMYKIGYGSLSVIVSLSDFSWKIERESEEICSYNYVEHKEMSRFCNYFIDNAIKK